VSTDPDNGPLSSLPVPSERALRVMVLAVVLIILAVLALVGARIFVLSGNDQEQTEQIGELKGALTAQGEALKEANRRLEQAGQPPVPEPDVPVDAAEVQDAEVQNAEIQEPEDQDPEIQDPETQQPERNDPDPDDPEVQDPENQDPEGQDDETDDPDPDDPENQDPENQDPEVDDPDPNSLLDFAVRDECHPVAGEYVTDTGLGVEKSPNEVTFVLTCTTAPLPAALLDLF
jgi:hypothetical protein